MDVKSDMEDEGLGDWLSLLGMLFLLNLSLVVMFVVRFLDCTISKILNVIKKNLTIRES